MVGTRAVRATLVALALGAIGAVAARQVAAQPGGGCGREGFALERLERRVGALGLDDETKQAVYRVIDRARDEQRGLDEKIHAEHERMRDLLDQDQPAPDPVLAQADAIGALATEARKADLRAMMAIRGLLTAEQWKELHEWRHGRAGSPPPEPGA